MMGIRWGNGIPSALRGTTAVYANGYAVRCVKPAVFPRRCSITLRHLPSDFSISTTDLFEAAYILGHHLILFETLAKNNNIISSQEVENEFINLTKIATEEIKSESIKPISSKMSTGGYLLFTLHSYMNNYYFSCMMIKKHNGVTIDENLNITSSIYIDLKKLLQSFTLNLTRHSQIRLNPNSISEENLNNNNDDLTYLKFIGHNKNQDPGADYFINAFGCERGCKSKIVTNDIIKGIDDFCKNPILKPFKPKIKDSIIDYLSNIQHNKFASLSDIKNVLNTCLQSILEIPEQFEQEVTIDNFINKLNGDKEDGRYGIPNEFPVNQTIVKKFIKEKISENSGWEISFRRGLFGTSVDDKIHYKRDEKSLIIRDLSESTIRILDKILKG